MPKSPRGQALMEIALIFPLFTMVLMGIIIIGIGVFYQQQVTNAAREAARWAALHSATSDCPVVGSLHPDSTDPETGFAGAYGAVQPEEYAPGVAAGCYADWTRMNSWARERLFGLNPNRVLIEACWSSYHDASRTSFDAPPPGTYIIAGSATTFPSTWAQCKIGGLDPTTDSASIGCDAGVATDDTGSAMSEGPGVIIANRVTAYACYVWQPPMAGFLLIPNEVTLRGVVTEPIQRQQ